MLDHLDDPEPFIPNPALRRRVGQRGNQLRRRHRWMRAALAVAAVVTLAGSGVLYVERRDAAIDRVDIAHQPSVDGAVNVLLVGSDAQPGVPGRRADTIAVLRLQPDGSVRVLSIPRDLWDPGSRQRISQSYEGGPRALLQTVARITGIPVDHYVEMEFLGFVRLVDEVGGLPLKIDTALRDDLSGLRLQPDSCRRLDGATALALVRSRHLEYRDGKGKWQVIGDGDIGRIARGQALLNQAAGMLARSGTDPASIDRLTRLLADHATLDDGLSLTRLATLARRLAAAGPARTSTETVPTHPATAPDGSAVLELDQGVEPLFSRYGAPGPTGDSPTATPDNTTAGLLHPC